jgi:hypothetical protein
MRASNSAAQRFVNRCKRPAIPGSPIAERVLRLQLYRAEGASFFTLSKRKGLPHLSRSRPRDRRFHVERKIKQTRQRHRASSAHFHPRPLCCVVGGPPRCCGREGEEVSAVLHAIKMGHHSIVLGALDEDQCRRLADCTADMD